MRPIFRPKPLRNPTQCYLHVLVTVSANGGSLLLAMQLCSAQDRPLLPLLCYSTSPVQGSLCLESGWVWLKEWEGLLLAVVFMDSFLFLQLSADSNVRIPCTFKSWTEQPTLYKSAGFHSLLIVFFLSYLKFFIFYGEKRVYLF